MPQQFRSSASTASFSVEDLGLIDAGEDPALDNLTRLAAKLLDAPVSLISIVQPELDRQYFTSEVGLAEPWSTRRQTPLSHSFCRHVVADGETLVVPDSVVHPLVATNGAIEDLGVAAYLGAPIHDETGRAVGALCAIDGSPRAWTEAEVEIVDRLASCASDALKLKAELLRSEQFGRELATLSRRLTDAMGAGNVGLWEQDLESGECWISHEFAALHGCSGSGWMGVESLIDILHPDDRQELAARLRSDRVPNQVDEWLYRIVTADGTNRWLRARSCLLDRGPGSQKLVGACVDVTGEREREAAVAALNAKLVEANQDLDEFVRIMSHDLRSPLRGIRSLIGFVEDDHSQDIPAQARVHLAAMNRRAVRMEQLLDDLLAYAKAGTDVTHLTEVDPVELIEGVFEVVDCPAGIELRVESDVGPVVVDDIALLICVRNLVDNAIKHHDKQAGTVTVRFQRVDGSLSISVVDDGPGIPEKYQDRIFEPFRTLQSRDRVEGSGIGLAIVRRTVAQAGGTVDVESEPGRGSTFTLRWPESTIAGPELG